jgi:hypothetical protein
VSVLNLLQCLSVTRQEIVARAEPSLGGSVAEILASQAATLTSNRCCTVQLRPALAMKQNPQFGRPLLRKWTALLFVLVMAGFGFVQAVHVHDALAGQAAPASHCSLCVVAHSAALITSASGAPAPVFNSTQLAVLEPQLQSRLQVASSYIRPPPQDL